MVQNGNGGWQYAGRCRYSGNNQWRPFDLGYPGNQMIGWLALSVSRMAYKPDIQLSSDRLPDQLQLAPVQLVRQQS